MKPTVLFLISLGFLISACSGSLSGNLQASTWIDYPADGASLLLGSELSVLSHSSGPVPIERVELYVNGELVRSDANPDPGNRLTAMSQAWKPAGSGIYSLQILAVDASGAVSRSLPIRVSVVAELIQLAEVEVVEAVEVTPSATVTKADIVTVPTGLLNKNANCRLGPDASFEPHEIFLEGQTVPLDGRNADSSWLWVGLPSGSHCWVLAVNLDITIDPESLPVIASQPLAEESNVTEVPEGESPEANGSEQSPTAPEDLSVTEHICEGTTYSITLGWQDTASNESGHHIYRNNTLIATLAASVESYKDYPPQGGPYTYKVEAFNGAGSAAATTIGPGCLL